ncbi:MAG: HIT domain-containing protein [Bdellovibrio sp.]
MSAQNRRQKAPKKTKTSVKRKTPVKRASSQRTKKLKEASGQIRLGQEVWPMERDVLFRPDRYKYVRKLIKPEGCVFCKASKSEVSFETLCVYKSKHSMVLLNKFPYTRGHLLVLPQRHCGDLLKLSAEEFYDLQDTVRLAMGALNDLYQPGGMNLGMNHGAVAGAGIPDHLHYHLIPRWTGDLNFFPLIAETKVLVESLEQTYEKVWSILRKYE